VRVVVVGRRHVLLGGLRPGRAATRERLPFYAGGSELATGCDLVYVAEDAKIGYFDARFGVPDMQFHAWFMGMRTAMEMMLTGDSISGIRAGTELCALAIHQQEFKAFIDAAEPKGLVAALTERDAPFGDYRTTEPHEPSTG
jgi:hypothetical protein